METTLFKIEVLEGHKAEKIFRVLDKMGILVRSRCECVSHFKEKECQSGGVWTCERGYELTVPKKDREATISVAHAIDAME